LLKVVYPEVINVFVKHIEPRLVTANPIEARHFDVNDPLPSVCIRNTGEKRVGIRDMLQNVADILGNNYFIAYFLEMVFL
jgi:hypothetical protein